MNKLIVSLSPHVHGDDTVKKNMYGVLVALLPAFAVSLYIFGVGALIVTLTSVASCVFFEWLIFSTVRYYYFPILLQRWTGYPQLPALIS